jgi:RNA polymerase sigma factor (sigma-70 family)
MRSILLKYGELTAVVQAAQRGDGLAFTELVRSFQDFAVAVAHSILGDFALAEDAAQEAFVDAYHQLSTLREPGAFVAWFRTIIFKHCNRMTRRRKYPTTELDYADHVASEEPSPHDVLEAQSNELLIRDSIAALPESERTVILLYYMGDQSHIEIAQFMGITSNTVKTRLYSARRRMRDHLVDRLERSLKEARPSRDSQFTRRVLNATLPIQVYAVGENGTTHAYGSTVASRSPEVPRSALWFIEPRHSMNAKDWNVVFDLLERMQIPGVSIPEQATDELLLRLSLLSHLKYLDVRNSKGVTTSGVRHLSKLHQLEHLDLSGTSVGDAGLEVLRHLSKLRVFELRHHSSISDSGLSQLAHCPSLERVNVMGTQSGDGTVRALAGKARLREFFAGSLISDEGLAVLREFPSFRKWHGRSQGEMSLFSSDSHPNYLWLNLAARFTNKGLASLSGLDGLYALNLFGTAGHAPFDPTGSTVTAQGLEHLAVLPNLRYLGCCSELCTDEAMQQISMMTGLRFLMCQDAVAGDDGFVSLSSSGSIEYIWGRRCYNLTGRGFTALAQMRALRGLGVSCKNVDDRSLSALPRFPALRELMPIDVTDAGFRHIGACASLRALHCMYCRDTTDQATSHLAGLSRLQTYGAWTARITDQSLSVLAHLASIEKLHFYKCAGVTDAGLAAVAALPRLRQIDLEYLPNVSSDAALAFSANVRVNYLPSVEGE